MSASVTAIAPGAIRAPFRVLGTLATIPADHRSRYVIRRGRLPRGDHTVTIAYVRDGAPGAPPQLRIDPPYLRRVADALVRAARMIEDGIADPDADDDRPITWADGDAAR